MSVSDVQTEHLVEASGDGRDDGGAGPAPAQPRRRWPFARDELTGRTTALVAGGLLLATVVAWSVASWGMTDSSAFPRIGLALVGAATLYVAIDVAAKHVFGRRFDTTLWLCVAWLGLVVVAAILADVLPLAESTDPSRALRTPTLQRPDLFSSHPLGTDKQGLDILGGIVYGGRVSLTVGLGAVIVGMSIGGLLGVVAGYRRGKIEAGVNLFTDTLLAFPPLILLLAMVTILRPNLQNMTIALAILVIPVYVRISRANSMVFAQREFILAARSLGASHRRIVFRELLPNVALPVMSYSLVVIALVIVAEASLSFLGLGIRRPTPTWGNMIAAAQGDYERNPHPVFIPGIVLFLTVFSLNQIGERTRGLWDPRHQRR